SDLTEETVCLGDIYAIGETQVQVTQPRLPCWKLARRWQMKALTARVQEHGWGGWYHRVLKEGYVEAGMAVQLYERPYPKYSIFKLYALMYQWIDDSDMAAALSEIEALSPGWRERFADYAAEAGKS